MESYYLNDSTSYLEALHKHKGLGAGNFLNFILSQNRFNEEKIIELDAPYYAPKLSSPMRDTKYNSLSLFEVGCLSNRIARWYLSQGVRSKTLVALYVDESIEYFLHYCALNSIGALPIFLNSLLSPKVAIKFLEKAGASFIYTNETKSQQLGEASFLTFLRQDKVFFSDSHPMNDPFIHSPSDPILLAHTSGTTGLPKCVRFNHFGFFFGVKSQLTAQIGKKIFSGLPHSHSASISILMSSLLRGCMIKLQTKKNPASILSTIESFRPDLVVAFPKVLSDICRYDLDNYRLDSVAAWMSTGDANHEPHIRKLLKYGQRSRHGALENGSIFIDNFGSSEFGFAITRNVHTLTSNKYGRCIGRPFDWAELEVLQDNGEPTQNEQVGQLGVKSSTVTPGYWNDSVLTEKNMLRGFWLTGDLGYRDTKGNIFHLDRVTDCVNTSSGPLYSCFTEELVLSNYPEIFECSIYSSTRGGTNHPNMIIDPVEDIDIEDFKKRVNDYLAQKNIPVIGEIFIETNDANNGLTGKKLKRSLRDLSNPEISRLK